MGEYTRIASTISGINNLPLEEKHQIYTKLIPEGLLEGFKINTSFTDSKGNDLLKLASSPGSSTMEMSLWHEYGFEDPILYGHMTDTLNGQIHVLLYVINDPYSPRFDVDRLPDGTSTNFGTRYRNIGAEVAAMKYGLAPGQIRRGLGMLGPAIVAFERFVGYLGHDMYFAEPLYYHNAIIFERYGFAYEKGRKLMNNIQAGFAHGGDLLSYLDGSSPFREPKAADSIRLRSWAIHDNILGGPFNNVTMYKRIGNSYGVNTSSGCKW